MRKINQTDIDNAIYMLSIKDPKGTKSEGFKACQILDDLGFRLLDEEGIEPYQARAYVREDADRRAASRYYKKFGISSKFYEMHHSLTGHIIPIPSYIHRHLKHIGGVEFFNLKKVETTTTKKPKKRKKSEAITAEEVEKIIVDYSKLINNINIYIV